MADFTALKTAIQTYIKQNGNEEITGNILQEVLLAMVQTMGDGAINDLVTALSNEVMNRQNADGTLQNNITAEASERGNADTALGGRLTTVEGAITAINTKLSEGYVYSGIATPSTNPSTPSGKVFYIATAAGTYTNFGSLAVTQGINILKYNGSVWSHEQVYGVDEKPSKTSGNIISSSGVFKYIRDVIGEDAVAVAAGVYDVKFSAAGYLLSDGSLDDTYDAYGTTPYIPVLQGDVILFKGGFNNSALPQVAGYSDREGNGFVQLLAGAVYTTIQTITIPSGVNYIRAWSKMDTSHLCVIGVGSPSSYVREICEYVHTNNNFDGWNISHKWIDQMVRRMVPLSQLSYHFVGKYFGIKVGDRNGFNNKGSVVFIQVEPYIMDVTDAGSWFSGTTRHFDGTENMVAIVVNNGTRSWLCEIGESELIDLTTSMIICIVKLNTSGEHIILKEITKNHFGNEYDVVDVLENEQTISTSQTDSEGYIDQNGNVVINQTYSMGHTNPIEIPDGVTHIIFKQGSAELLNVEAAPNYVNCYTNNNYTGFLGRSNNALFASLSIGYEYVGKVQALPIGTKYISYFCRNNGNNMRMYGNAVIIGGIYNERQQFVSPEKSIILKSSGGGGGTGGKTGDPDTTEHFTLNVNCNPILQNVGNAITLEDSQDMHIDYGMIMLPSTYSRSGNPVPLVIGCHGAGGDVSASDSQTENNVLYQYLVANGYAVCDCNGIPAEWCQQHGVSTYNNIGSPIAMECYNKLYQYVQKHYNVSKDIRICGGSMGGLSSTNIVLNGSLPVIVQAIFCPVLDTYNEAFLNPWSGGLPKTAMGVIYGFGKDGNNNYIYDEEKLRGFNPMVNGMESYSQAGSRVTSVGTFDFTTHKLNGADVVEYRKHPCPVKIWHCEDDPVVSFQCTQRFATAIRRAGGNAVLRPIITGGHEPLLVGSNLSNPIGNTSYRGTTLGIKPVIEEIFLFLERYTIK